MNTPTHPLSASSPATRFSPTRLGGFVLLAALCAPAWADTTTLPGAMCQFEGSSFDRPTTGALLNTTPGSTGTAKMLCPLIRTQPVGTMTSTMTVNVHTKLNLSSATFECYVRVTLANGSVYDSSYGVMPPKTSGNGGYWTSTTSVTLPPLMPASANLRCNVPNLASNEPAGIMSYTVTD